MKNKIRGMILLLALTGPVTFGQSRAVDSLTAALRTAREDTNKVNLLFALSDQWEGSAPEKAIGYSRQAQALSRKLGHESGIFKAYRTLSYIFAFQARYDSLLHYSRLTYEKGLANKDTFHIAVGLFNMGEAFFYLSDYEKGLDHTLRAVNMIEGRNYTRIEANFLSGLQSTYYRLKKYDESVRYGLKAIELARKTGNKNVLAAVLTNMGHCYADMKELNNADQLYNEAIPLATELGNKFVEAACYEGKLDIALRTNRHSDIKRYAEKSLEINTELENSSGIFSAYHNRSIYYLLVHDFENARADADRALKLARENDFLEFEGKALSLLATVAAARHDIPASIAFGNEAEAITHKIFTESVAQKDAEMRTRYDTEKKEVQIQWQQADIRRKNMLNYMLMAGSLALLAITVLGYRNYTHRQKLQQQRISELETEKQLTATEAVLKGEEQERSRLAKDLHDGLGGMLSGIKLSLSNMKGNLIMTPENADAFERSIGMLDNTIREMRRVAHNLMPEMLARYGLDAALKELCGEISRNTDIETSYQSSDTEKANLEPMVAVAVYRIVQELAGNAIKHSGAAHLLVQVYVLPEERLLAVTVEDDGKGFDPELPSAGMGWSNIRNRAELLKAKLDVRSAPGSGTSVLLEINY